MADELSQLLAEPFAVATAKHVTQPLAVGSDVVAFPVAHGTVCIPLGVALAVSERLAFDKPECVADGKPPFALGPDSGAQRADHSRPERKSKPRTIAEPLCLAVKFTVGVAVGKSEREPVGVAVFRAVAQPHDANDPSEHKSERRAYLVPFGEPNEVPEREPEPFAIPLAFQKADGVAILPDPGTLVGPVCIALVEPVCIAFKFTK